VFTDSSDDAAFTGLANAGTNLYRIYSTVMSGNGLAIYTNGVQLASVSTSLATNQGFNLGTTYARNFGWANMQMSELILFSTNLDDTTRTMIVTNLVGIYSL
jgi:hypothetical protein